MFEILFPLFLSIEDHSVILSRREHQLSVGSQLALGKSCFGLVTKNIRNVDRRILIS